MSFRLNPFALAATLLMSGALAPARAQQAAPAPPARGVGRVAATPPTSRSSRSRASARPMPTSLNSKKNADAVVEVVTAEDVGKLPAKNVADTVQRLPGVNISSNSGGDGAFADANRVSIRGTAPSLTQTLINGHSVGSADWFIANQGVNGGASGRSVSYDLLPAEIVGQVTVYKTAQADLIEGGAAGSVDIETRSPLSLAKSLTLDGSISARLQHVDAQDRPAGQRPGRLEERGEELRRDLPGVLGEPPRPPRRPGIPRLRQGLVPGHLRPGRRRPRTALHCAPRTRASTARPSPTTSTRRCWRCSMQRKGAMLDVELKPTNKLRVDVNGFYSKLTETNQDSSLETEQTALIGGGVLPDTYTVNATACSPSATWNQATMPDYSTTGAYQADYDKYYRPGENARVYYADVDVDYAPPTSCA